MKNLVVLYLLFLISCFSSFSQNKEVEIGSYPFFRLGKIGVAVVMRSSSVTKLNKVKTDLLEFVKLKKIQNHQKRKNRILNEKNKKKIF